MANFLTRGTYLVSTPALRLIMPTVALFDFPWKAILTLHKLMKLTHLFRNHPLLGQRTYPIGSSNIPYWFVFLMGVFLFVSSSFAELDPRPAAKEIDQLIAANLAEQKLKAYPEISDEQFLRRTYLANIGRIPTIAEADEFLESTSSEKYSELIHSLLKNDAGYTAHHFQFWADLLRLPTGQHWSLVYQTWIKEQIAANTPYDELVRKLVSGHGLVFDNPAAGYYIRDTGMDLDNMSNTVRIFLGTRLECAQCHNHPFDKWTQMDYFRMAAFTYGFDHRGGNPHRAGVHAVLKEEEKAAYFDAVKVEGFPFLKDEADIEKQLAKSNISKFLERSGLTEKQFREHALRAIAARAAVEEHNEAVYLSIGPLYNRVTYVEVRHLQDTQLKLPHDYQYDDATPLDPVSTGTMFGAEIPKSDDPAERKKAYAEWLTSPDNPRFTQVIVNRLWKRTFGHGIFEPVDDLTDHTPISQPELLSYLEDLMRTLNYDVRAFQKVLFHTELFRREMHGEDHLPGLPFHFQGPLMKRMSAEQMWDSIVTLVLPNVDTHAPNRPKLLERIAATRATYRSLNERPLEEVLPRMKAAGDLRRGLIAEQRDFEKRITAAYEAGEGETAAELTHELKEKTRDVEKQAREIVLVDLKDGHAIDSPMMMGGPAAANTGDTIQFIKEAKPPKAPEGLDKNERKSWEDREKKQFQRFRETAKEMARAVDLGSPARRGHFLRDFGQSDRDVIENASSHASVPQSLYLLNSPLSIAIYNPNSVLGAKLNSAATPEAKIDIIYRSMFTRKPTEHEVARILSNYETHGEETIEDLVWALLNSRQFLFIQ